MNLRRLSAGLDFRGTVEGQRQTYYAFEGDVLVATGRAKIDRRHKGKQLVFNVNRP